MRSILVGLLICLWMGALLSPHCASQFFIARCGQRVLQCDAKAFRAHRSVRGAGSDMLISDGKEALLQESNANFPGLVSESVYVASSEVHGWGMFAKRDFEPGELLHEAPGRLVRRNEVSGLEDDVFDADALGEPSDRVIVGLGFAAIFNSAADPSADWRWSRSPQHEYRIVATFFALKPIKRGEEIFTCYGQDWFEKREEQNEVLAMSDQFNEMVEQDMQLSIVGVVSMFVTVVAYGCDQPDAAKAIFLAATGGAICRLFLAFGRSRKT